MYFHSSGYRRELHAAIRSSTRKKDAKKRPSLASNTSGADSGYTSSTSSSPTNTQPSPITSRVIEEDIKDAKLLDDEEIAARKPKKSSRSKKHSESPPRDSSSPSRQPDLVYSCPRPLAFPFHNDAHFLPVAEADPRDVARVAPITPPSRKSCSSSKASSFVTTPFDQQSACRSIRSKSSIGSQLSSQHSISNACNSDADTLRSRRSSIISNMQRSTVRSLRSLFQKDPPPPYTESIPPPPPPPSNERLPRLEIKKGTVQSLRELFSSKRVSTEVVAPAPPKSSKSPSSSPSPPLPPPKASDMSRGSLSSRLGLASRNAAENKRLSRPLFSERPKLSNMFRWSNRNAAGKSTPPPPTDTNTSSLLSSLEALPKPPSTPPQAKGSNKFSSLKKLSARVFSTSSSSDKTAPERDANPSPPPPPTKQSVRRSFFSSFGRSSSSSAPPPPKSPKQDTKDTTKTKTKTLDPEVRLMQGSEPTVVGRLWKSFKRFVTGKKTSRVHAL
ncbi:hypothetical protein VTP01DRAFT_2516 [Rhizomucor pusillus]|uniref:uncharacterized protein n=1 Tax=Rhizomucor pusillus TaxID=4840 RepID=UPI00374326CB